MKTYPTLILLLLLSPCFPAWSQSKANAHSVAAGILFPLGDFAATHLAGIGSEYAPARHHFGLVKSKHLALTYNGGIHYYIGKRETVSAYPYRYPAYVFIYGFGGLLYNPVKKTEIILYAGPGMGLYNGHIQFTIGSRLELNYSIGHSIAIGSGLCWMKESGADPLWALLTKAIMTF